MTRFLALAIIIFAPVFAWAQGADPFRPVVIDTPRPTVSTPANTNALRGTDFKPAGMDTRPTTGSSRVGQLQFKTPTDRERFEECRTQAQTGGTDVIRADTAAALVNAPYKNRDCTNFVVETMLNSMELAMRDDPEALAEFQRDVRVQNRYQELKKAFLITSADANRNRNNNRLFSPLASPESDPYNNMFAPPEAVATSIPRAVIQPKPTIPTEWWAQDYYFGDNRAQAQKLAQRQQIMQRQPQSNAPTPLQNVMQQAQSKEAQQQGRGNAGANTLPSFRQQNPDSYQ